MKSGTQSRAMEEEDGSLIGDDLAGTSSVDTQVIYLFFFKFCFCSFILR